MTTTINTHAGIESLFEKELPAKIRLLSALKNVDIQRISCEAEDMMRLAGCLRKQVNNSSISLDSLNSRYFPLVAKLKAPKKKN